MVKIRHQLNEESDIIQIAQRQKMEQFLAKKEQCEDENDEETCMAEWDVKIDDMRIHYEEQRQIVIEERHDDLESVRRERDGTIDKIDVLLAQAINQIESDTDKEFYRIKIGE